MASVSISPALKANARSIYRQLWRASSNTFGGDEPVLRAWRTKMRNDATQAKSLADPVEYEKNLQLGREVTDVLRKNIARIVRDDKDQDLYKLHLTERHELGDNESIKSPPPMELPPKGRRHAQNVQVLPVMTAEPPSATTILSTPCPRAHVDGTVVFDSINNTKMRYNTIDTAEGEGQGDDPEFLLDVRLPSAGEEQVHKPCHNMKEGELCVLNESMIEDYGEDSKSAAADALVAPDEMLARKRHNYSQLKKLVKQREVPALNEDDLEESFVRGSGPGGQSINKTNNNVQLMHKPTGIRVVCQHTRSLELNRMYARRILLERLDKIANPGLSKGDLQRAKQVERERRRRKKAKKQDKEDEEEREAKRKERKAKRKEEKRRGRERDEEDDDED